MRYINFNANDTPQYGTSAIFNASSFDLLFINIEGVPQHPSTADLSVPMRRLWDLQPHPHSLSSDEAYRSMGLCPEFGKVVCATAGVLRTRLDDEQPFFVTTTYTSDDEPRLLCNISETIDNFLISCEPFHYVCGHNILSADIPFLAKRLIINHLPLPPLFDKSGKNSVSNMLIDTAVFWSMGNPEPPAPAPLLATAFGIDVNLDDYDPAQAATLFHDNKDFHALALRSQRKALVAAQIFRTIRGEKPILPDHTINKE